MDREAYQNRREQFKKFAETALAAVAEETDEKEKFPDYIVKYLQKKAGWGFLSVQNTAVWAWTK